MYKDEIITALLSATLLIVKVLKGEITIQAFVSEYRDFYYYEALDGHEAGAEQQRVLDELQDVVELHRKVQMEVVDLVFLNEDANIQQYIDAGRITADQARERLKELSQEYDVDGALKKLRVRSGAGT